MDLVQKSLSVDFHQDKLTLVEYNGQPYVAMKPLVENMGLDWVSQHKRIQRKEALNSTTVKMTVVAQDGRVREIPSDWGVSNFRQSSYFNLQGKEN